MFYDKSTRRQFLTGMGKGALALPFLPSLLPRKAWALSTSPVRYVQYLTNTGVFADNFFPSSAGMQSVGTGVRALRLDSISGNMSNILNGPLDPFRKKLSIIKGLDLLVDCPVHNQCVPTTGAGTSNQYGMGEFNWSVDAVMGNSSKVYPSANGKQRNVVFCQSGFNFGNYSFDSTNGNPHFLDLLTSTTALMAKFTWSGQAIPANDPTYGLRPKLMQDVFADYKSIRGSAKISTLDKNRLESYMSLINEIIGSITNQPPTLTCDQPALNSDSDIKNQIRIIVAALACQLTNVVSFAQPVSSGGDDTMHFAAHHVDVGTHSAGMRDMVTPNIAYFLQQMDQVQESDGTLLDNSIFYYGNEFGSLEVSNQHVTTGMPIMVAGSAGGRLNPGYFIDYGGAAYNNLLVTFFNAMGMSSADYERGTAGFGSYAKNNMLSSARRTPLPFFYSGLSLG